MNQIQIDTLDKQNAIFQIAKAYNLKKEIRERKKEKPFEFVTFILCIFDPSNCVYSV